MTRDQLSSHFDALFSDERWHWFSYHFRFGGRAGIHPLAADIIDALVEVDARVPGFALKAADELSSLRGLEKHEPHYEQLLQRLAELHVIRRLVTHKWTFAATFDIEPKPGGGEHKNPEIRINGGEHPLLVEVKAPSLLAHIRTRSTRPAQMSTRVLEKDETAKLEDTLGPITLPRDNVVKDFLVSSEGKFEPFRRTNPDVRSIVVIVWDDFIYEPLSALLGQGSGLFTPQSFYRDSNDAPHTFSSVDGVLLIRHLHQLLFSTRGEDFIDGCASTFDYGAPDSFPFKAFIQNPHGQEMPEELVSALHGLTPSAELGAEYVPSDFIFWLNNQQSEA